MRPIRSNVLSIEQFGTNQRGILPRKCYLQLKGVRKPPQPGQPFLANDLPSLAFFVFVLSVRLLSGFATLVSRGNRLKSRISQEEHRKNVNLTGPDSSDLLGLRVNVRSGASVRRIDSYDDYAWMVTHAT